MAAILKFDNEKFPQLFFYQRIFISTGVLNLNTKYWPVLEIWILIKKKNTDRPMDNEARDRRFVHIFFNFF